MTARTYLTGDDLIALSARIAAELDKITGRVPSIAEDFNRLMREAPAAIGRQPYDLGESELGELTVMVLDAIAGRSGDVPAPLPYVSELGRDDDTPRRDWLYDLYRRIDAEDADR